MQNRISLARSSPFAVARTRSAMPDVGHAEQVRALHALPIWANLPAAVLERIAAQSSVLHFGKNQDIGIPEETASASCYLVSGQAKVQIESNDGRKKVVEIVGPGYSFDECVALTVHRPTVRVIALSPARVLCVPAQALQEGLLSHPSLALSMVRNMKQRLAELLQDLDSQSFDTAMQRFVRYIVGRLLPAGARIGCESVAVTLPAGKAVVASRLSLSPEYFSRMLRQLETEQLIAVDNRTIVIHDVSRLVATYGPGRF